MSNKILVTNIQRFSIHDGPGIRTTIFLKGCSLRCPWCSNPENISSCPQKYVRNGIDEIYGKYYTPEELLSECIKDLKFYGENYYSSNLWSIETACDIDKLPGGVTFSGGECLLQMKNLVQVCEMLHERGVHLAVETSLFVPEYNLRLAMESVDLFYVDIKILDSEYCKKIECGNIEIYLKNLETLLAGHDNEHRRKPVVLRIPVIGGFTDTEKNRKAVHDLIEKYENCVLKIELIKEHNLAESKYKSLNMDFSYQGVDNSTMEQYKEELKELGIPIEVCTV